MLGYCGAEITEDNTEVISAGKTQNSGVFPSKTEVTEQTEHKAQRLRHTPSFRIFQHMTTNLRYFSIWSKEKGLLSGKKPLLMAISP
ncbi:MAG: hypothetical protein FWG55_04845 [Candidatus Bathyarchaeota archaeon]|nr:hypothetical protein [Candidatus Termiticorpusculum sp.]